MQCELCGRTCECRPALVDGVKMVLCPGCIRFGQEIKVSPRPPLSSDSKKPDLGRIKKPPVKDIYKDMTKELVSGWSDKIKNAREKRGITREELGFRIGERTVTISKIENGDLRPSDKMIEKLQKELGITLIEEVTEAPSGIGGLRSGGSFTIGDFIKKSDK